MISLLTQFLPKKFLLRVGTNLLAVSLVKNENSCRRTHFFSVKDTAEVTIYSENLGFKGKAESDWAFSIFDKYVNVQLFLVAFGLQKKIRFRVSKATRDAN